MKFIKKQLSQLPIPERINIVPHKYELIAREHKINNEPLLMCTVYFSENETPTYKIYITKDKYITEEFIGTPKWSKASVSYLIITGQERYYKWYRYKDDKKYLSEDEATRKVLIKWLGCETEDEGFHIISRIQSRIREARIEEKESREQAPWDKKLLQTPPEPEDFGQWIEDSVYKNDRYIYYKANKRKATKGVCTYCTSIVDVPEGHANNMEGICPSCGSSIRYKCGREKKYKEFGEEEVSLYQKVNKGVSGETIYREYTVRFSIKIDNWFNIKKTIYIMEKERLFISSDNTVEKYYYGFYKQKKHRFIKSDGAMHLSEHWIKRKAYLYYLNIAEMKAFDERIKYLPEVILKEPIDLIKILSNRKRVLICERLAFAKLYKLAAEVTYIDVTKVELYKPGMKLNKFLGLENDEIDIVRDAEMSYYDIKDFKRFKKATGKRLTAEQYQIAHKKLRWDAFTKTCGYTSVGKAIKYMLNIDNDIYMDYLNMCEELKIDLNNMFNLFPKNLNQRHDEVAATINKIKNAKEKKRLDKEYKDIEQMEEKLNKAYAVENEKYFIRAPHSAYEILVEGQMLHHCVGGENYRNKMKEGKSFILFLRKKSNPNKPWYTIEVSNKNEILQYHGWGNRDEDKKDTDSIMKVFKNRLKKLKREDEKEKQQVTVKTQVAV